MWVLGQNPLLPKHIHRSKLFVFLEFRFWSTFAFPESRMLISALGVPASVVHLTRRVLAHQVQTPSKSYQQGDAQKSLSDSPCSRIVTAESDTPTFPKYSFSERVLPNLLRGQDNVPKSPVIFQGGLSDTEY